MLQALPKTGTKERSVKSISSDIVSVAEKWYEPIAPQGTTPRGWYSCLPVLVTTLPAEVSRRIHELPLQTT